MSTFGPNPAATAGQRSHAELERIFAEVAAPFAFVDLDAMWSNASGMLDRAGGKPIRVASKSLRSREVLTRALGRDDRFRGLLTFTLPETLWLADHGFEDLMLAYPTVDRDGLEQLTVRSAANPSAAPILMVDSVAHLDLIGSVLGADAAPARVCLDVDLGWRGFGGRVEAGMKRSPVRTVGQAVAMAEEIDRRPQIELVAIMAYEGQIAGVGDRPRRGSARAALRGAMIRWMQRRSIEELRERRAEIVSAVGERADLAFVNGGGTGSLELTSAEDAVTELAAGSGFYAPTLFDHFSRFDLRPAAAYAVPVVRRPGPGVVTALGGGYPASGAAGPATLPAPWLPPGLSLDREEGAGEVQTPLLGEAADGLELGDRVYFRHAKAGELCERFDSLLLVEGGEIVDEVATYRGEGRAFL